MIEPETPQTTSDAELVLRTRSGDAEAFGELWSRHYRSGITVARSMTASIDPDDLVQEAYARIFQAIQKGGGPNGSFRAYLFTSIRNTAAAWGRASRETAIDDIDVMVDPDTTEQATDEALDRSLTAKAFRSLPSRWQEVLWYTEIEQLKPSEVAPLLAMSVGAVSQLAFRAREGLREAWIQAHLGSAPVGSPCHDAITSLGAYARGNLASRERTRLETHLKDCTRCLIVAAEAKDVSGRLALVMLPLVLGVGAAGSYLAALQSGSVSTVALAAMPDGFVEVGTLATSAAGGASGSATGGSAGGSGSAGGVLGSVGLVVGASAAAVVIAGAVAMASILPGLGGTSASTALATGEELVEQNTLDAAEVEADPDIEPELTPYEETALEELPPETEARPDTVPAVPAPQPSSPPAPEGNGPGGSTPGTPGVPDDGGGTGDPDDTPGGGDGEGGSGEPETPVVPDGVPTVTGVSSAIVGIDDYAMTVNVSGPEGATVQVLIDGAVRASAVIEASGTATLEFTVTTAEYLPVGGMSLRFVAGEEVGPPTPDYSPWWWEQQF